mmetsp:Transcript_5045/g.15359  ORF Transcript_5045/g.15359 Transcript_5045/m.15359 type:complete len:127 (+) Transcript_5045:131-511(+)
MTASDAIDVLCVVPALICGGLSIRAHARMIGLVAPESAHPLAPPTRHVHIVTGAQNSMTSSVPLATAVAEQHSNGSHSVENDGPTRTHPHSLEDLARIRGRTKRSPTKGSRSSQYDAAVTPVGRTS